jgi:hypothetical protein
MSQITYGLDYAPQPEAPRTLLSDWVEPPARSVWQPVLMLVPVVVATGGMLFGSPILVDLSFLALTGLMSVYLIGELGRFSERFGLGGIVLFAGVLIWFCYDYLRYWFFAWLPHWNKPIPPDVVAISATCHMIYILCMVIGIRLRFGRFLAWLLTKLPEPPSPSNYFWVVVVTQIVGLIPYVFFTSEPFYISMYHQMIGGRTAEGAHWTVGRSGNLNFNWGGYVAQLLNVGNGGAVLAAFCVIFLRQNLVKNIFCILTWLLWLAYAFGTGTRGATLAVLMPVIAFVFIRYHVQAQELLHKYSFRAYVMVSILLLMSIAIIQIQIRYRNSGFSDVKMSDVSLTNIQGNEMFSTGLIGFKMIPNEHDYFYNTYPGEVVIMPIPNFLYWAAVAPVPRALWTSKPVDPSWKWYNAVFTGRSTVGGGAVEGTTISEGIVGSWYFRFGIAGVIEGGIFMGWLMGVFERALYNNNGRPLAFFAVLALLTWIFRTYRDPDFQDLADVMVALVGLMICMLIARPFLKVGTD